MMALRDILVVLNDSVSAKTRLDIAITLAQQHNAYLTGFSALDLLVSARPVLAPYDEPTTSSLMSWGARPPVDYPEVSRQAAEKSEQIEATFRECLRFSGLKGNWRMANGKVNETLVRRARQSDLVILGQVDPEHPPRPEIRHLIEDVLITSGRPILIVPYIGGFEMVGTKVLVGWNNSRESVRAINDAMPLLAKAQEITILEVVPTGGKRGTDDVSAADIAGHLGRHGVTARATQTVMSGISTSDALLSYAADLSADLMVVGGYGHSRLRELMLGGVTRELLQHMTLPVLMSH